MHATVVKISDYLTLEQVRRLRRKSDLAGALLVLHAWALIAASMALFVWWPNPFTFLIGVMVIGGRQLGLAILMHDAAHGLLFADRRWNDRVGSWPWACRRPFRSAAGACGGRSCAILRGRQPTSDGVSRSVAPWDQPTLG
jgi:hypothetical protein